MVRPVLGLQIDCCIIVLAFVGYLGGLFQSMTGKSQSTQEQTRPGRVGGTKYADSIRVIAVSRAILLFWAHHRHPNLAGVCRRYVQPERDQPCPRYQKSPVSDTDNISRSDRIAWQSQHDEKRGMPTASRSKTLVEGMLALIMQNHLACIHSCLEIRQPLRFVANTPQLRNHE